MITIEEHSGIFTLECKQYISWPLEKAWDFFSSPLNLARITPPKMGFMVTSKNLGKIYPGQIISYQVGILPFIKTNWVTEITHVNEPYYFVDEQRFGPYSMWHHEHIFEETANGLLMTDRVSFKIPLGGLGKMITTRLIRKQLLEIFNYRISILENLQPDGK